MKTRQPTVDEIREITRRGIIRNDHVEFRSECERHLDTAINIAFDQGNFGFAYTLLLVSDAYAAHAIWEYVYALHDLDKELAALRVQGDR